MNLLVESSSCVGRRVGEWSESRNGRKRNGTMITISARKWHGKAGVTASYIEAARAV